MLSRLRATPGGAIELWPTRNITREIFLALRESKDASGTVLSDVVLFYKKALEAEREHL